MPPWRPAVMLEGDFFMNRFLFDLAHGHSAATDIRNEISCKLGNDAGLHDWTRSDV